MLRSTLGTQSAIELFVDVILTFNCHSQIPEPFNVLTDLLGVFILFCILERKHKSV
jgi:hypothetical protein